ncbi:phosphoribosyl-dephospho-CoA transferase MdcG domain-containing protein [Roseateles violae]|uniref:Malonate decarboxylase holo-[acyl-carrier-protein] synthase n=1 Tax=Roseateles violae TaxID=3058042 RepID=A0ABT8DNZ3_9BURK|nr:phosphoribosyl-dephospho-CoA transferase MdcG domain-containing protein [Pelomonas sp. PFR6]MDN3920080.1 malonate decarboxylase holo-[acyl-carrier-protein] synthase [Pelomonas sp. PFR6]
MATPDSALPKRSDQGPMMVPLHPHLLAHLNPVAWKGLEQLHWDASERECLAYWKAARLPLLVTGQPPDFNERSSHIAMCIEAPIRWGRRKMRLRVAKRDVLFFDEFPVAARIAGLLPANARASWARLCSSFHRLGATPRVYGSYGWQGIAGGGYVHRRAELNLWLQVTEPDEGDEIVAILSRFQAPKMRLEAELLLIRGGAAVAAVDWREWRARRWEAMPFRAMPAAKLPPLQRELPEREPAEALA